MSPEFDFDDPVSVVDRLVAAAEAMRAEPDRRGSVVHLPDRGRLLMTGDLHDHPRHLAKVVEASGVAHDEDAHLVLQELIHGDRLVDGADLSYRMLAAVAGLVADHPGRVHVLLANHELAQMAGHSVSKGGGCMTSRFDLGLDRIFGSEADAVADAIGVFVRALPLAARTANGILLAHSVPGPAMMERFDPGVLERELEPEDYDALVGSAWMMVWGRGQQDEQMELLAERWDVGLFCLGHAWVEDGIAIGGPRTVLLNSDHEAGVVLPIDLGSRAPTIDEAMFAAVPLASLESAS